MTRAEELFSRIEQEGHAAVENLVRNNITEELFLDYKTISTNPGSGRLSDDDANNLGKAISGFGNSEGGIVIWGLDCRRNPATNAEVVSYACISDVGWFKGLIEANQGGLTSPPHHQVRNLSLPIPGQPGGVVVTLVPEGQSVPIWSNRHRRAGYYMRVGSEFSPVPHNVLAGMFGRRPLPKLNLRMRLMYPGIQTNSDRITIAFQCVVENVGRGFASGLFVVVDQVNDGQVEVRGDQATTPLWASYSTDFQVVHLTEQNFHGLAPGTNILVPAYIRLYITSRTKSCRLSAVVGSKEGPGSSLQIEYPQDTLEFAFENLRHRWGSQQEEGAAQKLVADRLAAALQ